MNVSKDFLKPVLRKLYSVYPDFFDTDELSRHVLGKEPDKEIEEVCLYLKDKGLIIESEEGCRISASGIDKLEGGSLI